MKTKKKKYKEPELYFISRDKAFGDCSLPGSSNMGGDYCENTGPSASEDCASTGTAADNTCNNNGPSARGDCDGEGGTFF